MTDSDIFETAKTIAQRAVKSGAKEAALVMLEATGDDIPKAVVKQEINRIIEQDPLRHSWRAWGVVWSTAAAILAIPEVQAGLQAAVGSLVPVAWAPVVPALMGAVWAGVSKARDVRQVRGR